LNKKIIRIAVIVLLFFAGLIAMTQESPFSFDRQAGELSVRQQRARWFRSNKGGMAIEEMSSMLAAMYGDYALAVDFIQRNELPDFLLPYYDNEYIIETRMLFEKGELIRTQWIFRETNDKTRLAAVFLELSENENPENDKKNQRNGFIEIYNESSLLMSEYRFFNNGEITRINNIYNNSVLISAAVQEWDNNEEEYKDSYTDYLRYNRSLFLRSVERVFHTERHISLADNALLFYFPRHIADALLPGNLIGEKTNVYPEFFGDALISKDDRLVFSTDARSRILSQTLYDEEGNIIWEIKNTWSNDRIVSTMKTEGGNEYLAEFEYNADRERILERNYKNGALERVVHTEGTRDIEELYFNNVAVLRAVWENGRKISETRINNR
jgi:antitoxin component YwqK of YwqJK toxin-antitoxin module